MRVRQLTLLRMRVSEVVLNHTPESINPSVPSPHTFLQPPLPVEHQPLHPDTHIRPRMISDHLPTRGQNTPTSPPPTRTRNHPTRPPPSSRPSNRDVPLLSPRPVEGRTEWRSSDGFGMEGTVAVSMQGGEGGGLLGCRRG
jgi:hypothetical protein